MKNNRVKVIILIIRRSGKLRAKNEEEPETLEKPGKNILGRGNRMYGSPESGKCSARSGN